MHLIRISAIFFFVKIEIHYCFTSKSFCDSNADEITIENCRAYEENYIYHEILLQNWKPD